MRDRAAAALAAVLVGTFLGPAGPAMAAPPGPGGYSFVRTIPFVAPNPDCLVPQAMQTDDDSVYSALLNQTTWTSGFIQVIGPSLTTVAGSIPLSQAPMDLAVIDDTVFVVTTADFRTPAENELVAVNRASPDDSVAVPLPAGTRYVAATDDSVFVVGLNYDKLHVVNAASLDDSYVLTMPTDRLTDVVASADGSVLVTNDSPGRLYTVDPAVGGGVTRTVNFTPIVGDVSVASDGTAYVLSPNEYSFFVVPAGASPTVRGIGLGGGTGPSSVALTPDGSRLFLGFPLGGRVSVVNTGNTDDSVNLTASASPSAVASTSAGALLSTGGCAPDTELAGNIDIRPDRITYLGAAAAGSSVAAPVLVRNRGVIPMDLPVGSFTLEGIEADVFQVTADACGGITLLPGTTCSVTVTATPPAKGGYRALLYPPAWPSWNESPYIVEAVGTTTPPVRTTPRTWFVASSGTPNFGAGTGCANPDSVGADDTAIRAVLAEVISDDTVNLCPGNYSITQTLSIDDSILLRGSDPLTTTLDGQGNTQIVRVEDARLDSSDVAETHLRVEGVGFVDGAAGSAAVYDSRSCTFFRTCGGAIYVEDGSSLTVRGSYFEGNEASFFGGAIATDGLDYNGGLLDIDTSTFNANSAHVDAGAVGIVFNVSSHVIASSTFVGNSALTRSGGAVSEAFAPNGAIKSSTFVDNVGANGNAMDGQYALTGNLMAGSVAGDMCGTGTRNANPTNLTTGPGCIDREDPANPAKAATLVSLDSLKLGALASNGGPTPTVWIGVGSTAIDANTGTCLALDQRGVSRGASPCDAGAVTRLSASAQALLTELTYAGSIEVGSGAIPVSTPSVSGSFPDPTYTTSDATCSVDATTGLVTGISAGSCTVSASILPSTTQDGADDSTTVAIVNAPAPTPTLTPRPPRPLPTQSPSPTPTPSPSPTPTPSPTPEPTPTPSRGIVPVSPDDPAVVRVRERSPVSGALVKAPVLDVEVGLAVAPIVRGLPPRRSLEILVRRDGAWTSFGLSRSRANGYATLPPLRLQGPGLYSLRIDVRDARFRYLRLRGVPDPAP